MTLGVVGDGGTGSVCGGDVDEYRWVGGGCGGGVCVFDEGWVCDGTCHDGW